MPFRNSVLCGMASEAVDSVKLEIPQGLYFENQDRSFDPEAFDG